MKKTESGRGKAGGIGGSIRGVLLLAATGITFAAAGCGGPESAPSAPASVTGTPAVLPLEPSPAATTGPQAALPDRSPPATLAPADLASAAPSPRPAPEMQGFPVPAGSRPHDVAPAGDGGVWYAAQGSGELGWLDPATGETRHTSLGPGSRPHGVIVGPDGAPWLTDGGLNAIVRVDPATLAVEVFPLPPERPNANLNTATFDGDGTLWFTGQNGVYGRLEPATGEMEVFDAPRGRGPYGIATTPQGDVYYASLAGSYVGRIDRATGSVTVLEPPTPDQGARRVWSDSRGRVWVSQWNAGQVAVYDPAQDSWREWKLPGPGPRAYAVYVDDQDLVWLSDFGANAMVRFDPGSQEFEVFPLTSNPSNVRQFLGRPGEVWLPESAADQLVVIRSPVD